MQEEKHPTFRRQPLKNFVFFPAIQWPLIVFNSFLVLLGVLGTAAGIALVYAWKFHGSSVYVLSQATYVPLEKISIVTVIAPAVIGCIVVAMGVGITMALSTSRRVALPIYKVIRWARLTADGDLQVQLGFRKGDRLGELAESCNYLSSSYRGTLIQIRGIADRNDVSPEARAEILKLLARYRIET
jgi:methyl-accepting chemotaxis protein